MNEYKNPSLQIGNMFTVTSDTLNNSPTSLKLAYSFIAMKSAIDYFWVNINTVTGAAGNIKTTFALQADSGGVPSDTDLGSYEVTGGWFAGSQRKITPSWSGITLTVGARYWIVMSNTSVSPTVDYLAFYRGEVTALSYITTYNVVAAPYIRRGFNGTNWTTTVLTHHTTLTIRYVGGGFDGLRYRIPIAYSSSWVVSATRALGAEFRVPKDSSCIWNVVAVGLYILNATTTKLRAYINHSLVAESPYGVEAIANGRTVFLPLSFKIMPGDLVSIMTETGTWSSLQIGGEQLTNDADFISMKPYNASVVKLDSGTTWTRDETQTPKLFLFFDENKPFLPLPLNRRQFNSGR